MFVIVAFCSSCYVHSHSTDVASRHIHSTFTASEGSSPNPSNVNLKVGWSWWGVMLMAGRSGSHACVLVAGAGMRVCWLPGQAGARVPHCTGKHPPQGTSTGATRVNCRAIGMCIVSGRQARRMRGSHRSPPDATGGATQMRSHAGGSHAGSHAKTSRTTAHCPPTPHRTIRPTATLPHIATHCSDTLLRPCGHSTRHTEPAAPLA